MAVRNNSSLWLVLMIVLGATILPGCSKQPKTLKICEPVVELCEYLGFEECGIIKLAEISEDFKTEEYLPEDMLSMIQQESLFDIPEQTIIDYATQIAIAATPDYILYADVNFDEYLYTYYGITADSFFEECCNNARDEIEYYLTVGAIAQQKGIVPEEDDVSEWIRDNNLNTTLLDAESLCYIKFYIIERDVLSSLIEVKE